MGALVDGLSPERRSDLLFLDDTKVKFRDNEVYIHSDTDGKLLMVADSTEADAIELSGKTTLTGASTITGATGITGNVTIVGDVSAKLSTADGSTAMTVKDSDGVPVSKIDSKGNLKTKGTVSKI